MRALLPSYRRHLLVVLCVFLVLSSLSFLLLHFRERQSQEEVLVTVLPDSADKTRISKSGSGASFPEVETSSSPDVEDSSEQAETGVETSSSPDAEDSSEQAETGVETSSSPDVEDSSEQAETGVETSSSPDAEDSSEQAETGVETSSSPDAEDSSEQAETAVETSSSPDAEDSLEQINSEEGIPSAAAEPAAPQMRNWVQTNLSMKLPPSSSHSTIPFLDSFRTDAIFREKAKMGTSGMKDSDGNSWGVLYAIINADFLDNRRLNATGKNMWIQSINMVRHWVPCMPILIWHDEASGEKVRRFFEENGNVTGLGFQAFKIISAFSSSDKRQRFIRNKDYYSWYALTHSPFDISLYLDADILPVRSAFFAGFDIAKRVGLAMPGNTRRWAMTLYVTRWRLSDDFCSYPKFGDMDPGQNNHVKFISTTNHIPGYLWVPSVATAFYSHAAAGSELLKAADWSFYNQPSRMIEHLLGEEVALGFEGKRPIFNLGLEFCMDCTQAAKLLERDGGFNDTFFALHAAYPNCKPVLQSLKEGWGIDPLISPEQCPESSEDLPLFRFEEFVEKTISLPREGWNSRS